MAKPSVERAPAFELDEIGVQKIAIYLKKYDATDKKGRYLHWNLLKWRVPRNEAKGIWQAIKFKRHLLMRYLELFDEKKHSFSYCIPHSMEARLHKIVKMAGGNIAAIANDIASESIQQKFLVSSLLMEEAITSAQLEGASTTRAVAKKMLEEDRKPLDKNERMILNNFLLLQYAEKHSKEALTLDLILEFHRIATIGTNKNDVIPGEFRIDNDIYIRDNRGEIAHYPPDFKLIHTRMQALCDFANTKHSGENGTEFIAPVVKAIILHFMLGYEHPFRDGNGRTARALFYWYMLKNEYNLFKYVSISKLLKKDPKGYGLSYLYTEKDENDLTYFIDYQLDIILAAFEELKIYLNHKTKEFYKIVTLLEHSKFNQLLNFVQKDIIKKGTKAPGRIFSVKEISTSYEISTNTARSYLNKLANLKLLLKTKDKRTILYFAPSDLRQRLT